MLLQYNACKQHYETECVHAIVISVSETVLDMLKMFYQLLSIVWNKKSHSVVKSIFKLTSDLTWNCFRFFISTKDGLGKQFVKRLQTRGLQQYT